MKITNLAPCINLYTDIYDASKFLELIEAEASQDWPRLEWSRSTVISDNTQSDLEYRSSLSMSLRPIMTKEELVELKETKEEFGALFKHIDECIWDYRNTYDLPLTVHEVMSVLKYEGNAEYRFHWDAGPGDAALRVLSMVAFLNDDYVGGELEFPHFELKITPQKGSVVLFPSSYPYAHIAHPVTTGVKYSLVTWFLG